MTVSRALSDHPNVLKETRALVRQRAAEMGYVKSAAAKAMRGDATRIVGLLLPNIVNEFYARFANTMALACEAKSLQLVIHLTGDDSHAEAQALKRLQEIQAQGVVMVPAPCDPDVVPNLHGLKAVQLIRQSDIGQPVPAILVDDAPALRAAVASLANMGHRDIAYIGADQAMSSGPSRLAAFREGLEIARLMRQPSLEKTGAPSAEIGHALMSELLTANVATAVVCGGVEISNGALRALLEADQPQDRGVDFIGYGDASFYSWIGGGVSTIFLPVEQLATKAADLLSEDRPEASILNHVYPAELIQR